MQIIPINDTPAQTLNITLANQNCMIYLYTRTQGLVCDLYVNDVLIIGGVICQNLNLIVRDVYLGFTGDLMFVDMQGTSDPVSPGLNTRYFLMYVSTTDLATAGI